jgi:ABC-2 type transport system ATP-binding protein
VRRLIKDGPVLNVQKAKKTFAGSVAALDGVSFAISGGERVALLGRNGAGKSTLIKSVSSLIKLDQGEIRVNGQDVSRERGYLAHVGVTLEGARNIYWRLTPFENVRYFAGLRAAGTPDERIKELLDQFEVPNARTSEAGKLSTGNKQKVAIICALIHDPALLLLDEPTLGLDVEAVANVRRILQHTQQHEHRAFLITSHDLSFVQDVCERVIVLDKGRVLYDGPLSVLRASASGYTVKIVLKDPVEVAAQWADRAHAELTTSEGKVTISFHASRPEDIFSAFDELNGDPRDVLDLDISKTALESAYLNLAKEHALS